MSSPITFSGFNNIDFSVVLNAIMQQESQPLNALTAQQTALQSTNSAYGVLATKLSTLESAAQALSTTSTVTSFAATSSDAAVGVTATGASSAGRYEIVVNQLAHAQVTASTSTVADTNSTVVATGGSLTIGSTSVAINGPVTLQDLVNQINQTPSIGATASVVQSGPGAFKLVLTSTATGAANAFSVTNQLTGGTNVTFGANAVNASDASALVNNIAVTSPTNTLTNVVAGVSLTLTQQDPAKTVVVQVSRNDDDLKSRLTTFISAYNDLVAFATDQRAQAAKGTTGTLARDSVLTSARNALRTALGAAYGTGTFTKLAEVGLGFTQTGQLTLDQNVFNSAMSNNAAGVASLFAGASNNGAFSSIQSIIASYTNAGGFVPSAETRNSDTLNRLGSQIDAMQARLAIRRAALQKEFTAADAAMSQLNSQSSALGGFTASLSSLR